MFLNKLLRCAQAVLVIACFVRPALSQTEQVIHPQAQVYSVGVAKVDITPNYPVRMNGFLVRKQESVGIRQPIWAKALAVGQGDQASVIITFDGLGIPAEITQQIGERLREKAGLDPARLSITASHSHTAPMINGCTPNIFGEPIPADAQAHIDRYTQEFTDKLEQVGLAALKDRRDAILHYGVGLARFAKNRRDKNGPFDHDLPLLVVRDLNDKIRALYVSYACHCVTLSEPQIGGDWAGFAQAQIEKRYPDAIAMTSVGCAGDQNPSSGVVNDRADLAQGQGEEIAVEVDRLLSLTLHPVSGPLTIANQTVQLPLDKLPTREELELKAKETTPIGYHARVQLAKLDRGQTLRDKIDYRIQTWSFGDSLAMVFLPGEVVSEYGLRLKNELDGRRVWVNAYSNACPCYIPSEKVLKVGGYEGGGAMIYYDQPTKFAPGLEKPIIETALRQLQDKFPPQLEPGKGQGTRPRAAEQSLKLMRTDSDLQVDLVAAEPLVTSPVAVDFGADGKVYVAEMFDYPAGVNGTYTPAGRIRVLSSSAQQTGKDKLVDASSNLLDTSTIFLSGIPFPTGVTVWRNGILVCAAPDILYAEDSDGDGRADIVRKLYSGFGTDNFQARVNSLEVGLDGWVYGSCGLFGGSIRSFASETPYELGNRDFRIQPDTGAIEAAVGTTQQGRVRDCFANWFGCDNSNLARHYPLATHVMERNPNAPPPAGSVNIPAGPADNRLIPGNDTMQLFKLSGGRGVATAACGLGVYRDTVLGDAYQGNLFTCEPVNLLVHRLQLAPRDSSFAGTRPANESDREFLSSSDTWFRPVQARTAPDGSLWVLDMYRFVIEHPRWIPPESLEAIDTRAGSSMGRIYRVRPSGQILTWPRLDKLSTAELVAALDSSNGWQRDMAMQMLTEQQAHPTAGPALIKLLKSSKLAETRVQVLSTLDQRHELTAEDALLALQDQHPGVRRHALRVSEQFATKLNEASRQMLDLTINLAQDGDAQVRLQAACSLGAWSDVSAAQALANLVLAYPNDRHLRSAVISSLTGQSIERFMVRLNSNTSPALGSVAPTFMPLAFEMLPAKGRYAMLGQLAQVLTNDSNSVWRWTVLGKMLDEIDQPDSIKELASSPAQAQVQKCISMARTVAQDDDAADGLRSAAITLLNRSQLISSQQATSDQQLLISFLSPRITGALQNAATTALLRSSDARVAQDLLTAWPQLSPGLKTTILDALLTRPQWIDVLLDRLEQKQIDAIEIDAARRQQLLAHRDDAIKARAEKLLAGKLNPDREQVLQSYAKVVDMAGDATRGADLFRKNCATCHRMGEVGAVVGPDLAALANKPANFFLQEILDPNRNLDSRYMAYTALTDSGRTLTGLLVAETGKAITLRAADAKEETLQRDELEQFRSTRASLMPEGLEKLLPQQAMADVIAFVKGTAEEPAPPESMASGELARDMLNDRLPMDGRVALVPLAIKTAPEVITAMAANLPRDEKEEYRRIPWLWRVAVAAGKEGDTKLLKKVIEVALPREGAALRDWQAVVIGGGVINGLGLSAQWPGEHIDKMLKGDDAFAAKWREVIAASKLMADDEKVRKGTRYDALRVVALAPWPEPREQLLKYIGKDVDAEIQMGSVSGLADINTSQATQLLIDHLPGYAPENRRLAIVALTRSAERKQLLQELVKAGKVKAEEVP